MKIDDLTHAEKIELHRRVEDLVREQVEQRLNHMNFKTQIAKLRLEHDDVLVLQTDLMLTKETTQQLRTLFDQHVKEAFPNQTVRTLLLISGLKLSIGKDIPLDWIRIER